MGASGDVMFGPWAAYFPVSLCQGCDIVTFYSISIEWQVGDEVRARWWEDGGFYPAEIRDAVVRLLGFW